MTGTLHVVATPIGNLDDITLRALRVLRTVALIAAEDTRRIAKLLTHHGISTPTISFHEHNARTRAPQLVARLQRGDSVAVVTDAGTPGVSDPGIDLVQMCIAEGIPIDPVPGASALLAAVVASGFPATPLSFIGFCPPRGTDRKRFWSTVSGTRGTVVFFEAPHRIEATLREAAGLLGNRPLCVARELTKVHQEFLRGTATELVNSLKEVRGEFTVVVGPVPDTEPLRLPLPAAADLATEFRQLTAVGGLDRRGAISALARKYGRSAREVYGCLEVAKHGVS
jgi:16S rRNA (cytidine1402-2'-O)-methyltransferase